MWRCICAVVLVPLVVAESQAADLPVTPQKEVESEAEPPRPSFRPYTYYTAIRQGTSEKVALDLMLGPRAGYSHPHAPIRLE